MNNNWKIGDKVLCVKTHPYEIVVAGNEYIVDGFVCCPVCGHENVYLKGIYFLINSSHCTLGCGNLFGENIRQVLSKSRFIKPDLSSLTNYHNEVSVREISVPKELKELSNLQNQ